MFLINDALVLNTVKNDFSLVSEMGLMKTYNGSGYTYHLYTDFSSDDEFTVTQLYANFEPDSEGKPKPGTIEEVRVVNQYRISDDGEIERRSKSLFGEISVNHPKM